MDIYQQTVLAQTYTETNIFDKMIAERQYSVNFFLAVSIGVLLLTALVLVLTYAVKN